MSSTKKPAPPEHLDATGVTVWNSIVKKYDLRADELVILADAAGASDMLAALELAWREAGKPMMSKGSMGQEVEHPLIGSIDKQRKTRNYLLAKLKLPDDPANSGAGATNQARSAAQSRWAQHGAGA